MEECCNKDCMKKKAKKKKKYTKNETEVRTTLLCHPDQWVCKTCLNQGYFTCPICHQPLTKKTLKQMKQQMEEQHLRSTVADKRTSVTSCSTPTAKNKEASILKRLRNFIRSRKETRVKAFQRQDGAFQHGISHINEDRTKTNKVEPSKCKHNETHSSEQLFQPVNSDREQRNQPADSKTYDLKVEDVAQNNDLQHFKEYEIERHIEIRHTSKAKEPPFSRQNSRTNIKTFSQSAKSPEKVDFHPNGLPNIGMTCYANSILQVFGQTPGLRQYLLDSVDERHREAFQRQDGAFQHGISHINEDRTKTNKVEPSKCQHNETHSSEQLFQPVNSDREQRNQPADSKTYDLKVEDVAQNNDLQHFKEYEIERHIEIRHTSKAKEPPFSRQNSRTNIKTFSQSAKSPEKVDFHPNGLPNIGMTCYANSILQVFGQTPGLRQYLLDSVDERHRETDPSANQLFNSLLVPLPDNEERSVERGLDILLQSESLDVQLTCKECGLNRETRKKIHLTQCPQILVLQLGTFEEIADRNGNKRLVKNNNIVTFENTLNIPQENGSQCHRYQLYGVVSHSGTLQGGHYTAHVKHGPKWYYCNDNNVSATKSPTRNNNIGAYLLFYRKNGSEHQIESTV